MYRIRIIQSNGRVMVEPYLNMARTLERFYELVTKKAVFSALNMDIYLEELNDTQYIVHKTG